MMIVATRNLQVRSPQGNTDIPVRIFAPVQAHVDWSCRFEIDWPDGKVEREAVGIDAIQALVFAMQMIGAQFYTSELHQSGRLMFLEVGNVYGFPVMAGIRDLLEVTTRTISDIACAMVLAIGGARATIDLKP